MTLTGFACAARDCALVGIAVLAAVFGGIILWAVLV